MTSLRYSIGKSLCTDLRTMSTPNSTCPSCPPAYALRVGTKAFFNWGSSKHQERMLAVQSFLDKVSHNGRMSGGWTYATSGHWLNGWAPVRKRAIEDTFTGEGNKIDSAARPEGPSCGDRVSLSYGVAMISRQSPTVALLMPTFSRVSSDYRDITVVSNTQY